MPALRRVAPPPLDLYVILDRQAAAGRDLEALAEAVLAGGARWIQLREKEWTTRALLPLAGAVGRRVRAAGGVFIVNDRLDVALAVEADGLHVGQDDLPAPVARRLLPDRLLGISTHSPEQAVQAQADGADYVAIGAIFPTATKAAFELVGLAAIRRARPLVSAPLVAIGGITLERVRGVIEAGADAVAVVSAIGAAEDPARATAAFLAELRAARRPGKA